ncbi:hypothetical protein TNCT_527301 [Trichonephila clavata]|uniref:Uncharacterized protein n=1 Tax=Trichonephila clavata TaxID=2740835 RepID=A0A8X6GV57_TRICU|nr:hypothetical protein TNCT_527301 [Trichonephila clavata]
MSERIANAPNLLESVLTCDETWNFTYDPESKHQVMQWKSPDPQDTKKYVCQNQTSTQCQLSSSTLMEL